MTFSPFSRSGSNMKKTVELTFFRFRALDENMKNDSDCIYVVTVLIKYLVKQR